jgi:pimeloyl-ACP methyl ester carboxylesterase
MDTLELADTTVRYEVRGDGDPVLLLHANPFVDWYLPVIERMPHYSFVRYTRLPRDDTPLSMARDAETCAQLAEHLGWGRAHVVGHSAGALAALHLAVDAPDLVHTLSLLEPAAASPSGNQSEHDDDDPFAPIVEAYARGDNETATERFLELVCGAGSRAVLEQAVPGAFEHAVQACDFFLQVEAPAILEGARALQDVSTKELAKRVKAPVLNVVGERSKPGFVDGARTVQGWFPHAERFTLPGATHLLMVEQPDAMTAELLRFFEAHPLT